MPSSAAGSITDEVVELVSAAAATAARLSPPPSLRDRCDEIAVLGAREEAEAEAEAAAATAAEPLEGPGQPGGHHRAAMP